MSMAKDFARQFYSSQLWVKARASFIAGRKSVDGGLCEVCRLRIGDTVHHKEPITPENINDVFVTTGVENLMLVCRRCHDRFPGHGWGGHGVGHNIVFDEDGDPIARLD